MLAAQLLFLGLVGGVVGSFLNVVVHRLPRGESVVSPRSRCPGCGTPVAARDNVPVLSWLLLRGRCRHCGDRISARYPALELVTALVFMSVGLARGADPRLVAELPFAAALIAIAAIDLEHRIVPNRIVLPAAVFALLAGAVVRFGDLPELLIAGAGAFAFLLLAALAYPAGMGMGDVKLAGVMGLFLGLSVVPALFLAFLLGALVGVGMILSQGPSARKKGVPFAPFLAAGGFAALVSGPQIISLYTERFLS
jgi:leader peptidase (prepilin peptidase)/N-methyltransferase